MANEEALLDFVQGVEWDKYENDDEVIDLLTKVKARVEELDDGEEDDDPDKRAKVVVVGDGAVGKTCLFITYATGKFPEEYVPTVFENYTHETTYKNEPFLLHMWDTAGQEDYDRLRPLSYPGTEVVVLCFSLVSESTFESIRVKWNPEINHYLEDVPKVLVGTKLDMREQKIKDGSCLKYEEITTEEGQDLAKEIGAIAYVETSPLTGKNLKEVFEKVIAAALSTREEPVEKKPKKSRRATSSSKSDGDKKKRRKKKEGEDGKERRKKKSSKRKDETDEERRERRRKRKEAKEAKEGKEGKEPRTRKKRTKTEDGEPRKKKSSSKRKAKG
eukprot:CAMPEP_0117025536 /NCGR_PEP_ID=MMETSP0472-20121206/18857_1 /TAXON_ID=693140 ORGANISM="Tiarina fusus, Strain LIS" /NCGR_SAMPLE_ID=MMETSP0472 /ASSEMBLY_ACC=CAM_ASM_000603 /LENGTH=330 /DNA_ID=CAMNT_0004732285 /DNA_START=12 /DNA_END=1004 /DNA_ORIENTATION=+